VHRVAAVEYAIMASLIAMVIIGAVTAIGLALSAKFDLVSPILG
jgi:Flp pilus assembly pilin Flp